MDGLVLRYRVDQTDDGLHGRGGAPSRSAPSGSPPPSPRSASAEAARDMCERLLTWPARSGLYAEELDARTGRHWGNFPQAFTHLALINAVSHVISDDRARPATATGAAVLTEMISAQTEARSAQSDSARTARAPPRCPARPPGRDGEAIPRTRIAFSPSPSFSRPSVEVTSCPQSSRARSSR